MAMLSIHRLKMGGAAGGFVRRLRRIFNVSYGVRCDGVLRRNGGGKIRLGLFGLCRATNLDGANIPGLWLITSIRRKTASPTLAIISAAVM